MTSWLVERNKVPKFAGRIFSCRTCGKEIKDLVFVISRSGNGSRFRHVKCADKINLSYEEMNPKQRWKNQPEELSPEMTAKYRQWPTEKELQET